MMVLFYFRRQECRKNISTVTLVNELMKTIRGLSC